jgi:hypothetical protein
MYCFIFYVLIFVLVLIFEMFTLKVREWATVNYYVCSGIHQQEEVHLCVLNWFAGACVRARVHAVCVNTASSLIFVWPCIIDTNNIDNQLDATITVY